MKDEKSKQIELETEIRYFKKQLRKKDHNEKSEDSENLKSQCHSLAQKYNELAERFNNKLNLIDSLNEEINDLHHHLERENIIKNKRNQEMVNH